MKFRRIMAIVLTFIMTAAVFAGCGKAEQKEGEQSQESVEQVEEQTEGSGWEEVAAKVDIPTIMKEDPEYAEWMDSTSPVTLSVFYPYGGTTSTEFGTWGETPIQQKITELTGVTIDGSFPSDTAENDLTLMLASGDKLPDIIKGIDRTGVHYNDLVESDSLYDIKELIEEYCPTMWDNMDPYIRDTAIEEDGHMWYLPVQAMSAEAEDYMVSNGWFVVRADVCEDLGIDPQSIATLDDMNELMRLYTENADQWPEIKYPIWFPGLTGFANPRPFYDSYGGMLSFDVGLDMIYDEVEDSVHYWVEDEYGYDALKYMWSLAQNGYVTEASFGMEWIYDEMMAGSVLIACGENMWYPDFVNPTIGEEYDGARYELIHMVSASEDIDAKAEYHLYNEGNTRVVVIPKDCSDPERAIKFLQFMDSEYANLLVSVGIYGEDWEEDVDEYGTPIIKYIGEAETAEGRAARGICNYEKDWFNFNAAYDYLPAYSTDFAGFMKEVSKEDIVYDVYATTPSTVMNSEPGDSEYALLRERVNEIIVNYQTKMILASDEAAFDALYEECLQVLEENNIAHLKEYVLGLTQEYIAEMESMGVSFDK